MKKIDKLFAQMILMERMLSVKLNDFVDEMKQTNPKVASLIRNDVRTLLRNHEYFYSSIRSKMTIEMFSDLDKMEEIFNQFFEE